MRAIDFYDMFDLMGLSDMKPTLKKQMFDDINMLIWEKFLSERLGMMVTAEQLIHVRTMMSQGKKLPEALKFIQTIVPNFNELLAQYTRDMKIMLLRKHYIWMAEESEKNQQKADDEKVQNKYYQEMDKYFTALELLEQQQWDKIVTLFTTG